MKIDVITCTCIKNNIGEKMRHATITIQFLLVMTMLKYVANQAVHARAKGHGIVKQLLGSEWQFWPDGNHGITGVRKTTVNYFDGQKFCQDEGLGELAFVSYKEYKVLMSEWLEHLYADNAWDDVMNRWWSVWLNIRRKAGTSRFIIDDDTGTWPYQIPWAPNFPLYHIDLGRDACVMMNLFKTPYSITRVDMNETECYGTKTGVLCKRDITDDCKSSPCSAGRNCVDFAGGYLCEEIVNNHSTVEPTAKPSSDRTPDTEISTETVKPRTTATPRTITEHNAIGGFIVITLAAVGLIIMVVTGVVVRCSGLDPGEKRDRDSKR